MVESVSVVIPIYNQAHLVARTIESLAANTRQPDEIIIVDDGSTDDVQEAIRSFQTNSPLTIRLLKVPHGGPGRAREAGWKAARGNIVAFTDADAVPARDWLEQGLKGFTDERVGGVEGAVESSGNATIFTHQVHNRFGRQFMTANMFYRRSVIEAVGGFKSPYREDSDLAFSVLGAGYRIIFVRDAVVFHPPRQESWRFYFSKAHRKRYEGFLFRNHPDIAPQYLPRFQPTELFIILGELLSLLSLWLGSWALILGLLSLLIGLPKRLADWLDGRKYNARDYLIAWILTLLLVPVEFYYHWLGILKPPPIPQELRKSTAKVETH
ncbi:glycosyltransferase family 2 protein [Sulfobacillus thermosulfidooxidans]|uniref:glycosyltransferase family 2 protein n=1 Tax=Sulfobacillus thermosulfidooxidans TaxID=28034 RepID=UPI0006B69392|nr:glycosyltransferase family A protein [Sulfobacillus thermosulfidooxidans]